MDFITRYNRALKGCLIAGSGYAFFAVSYIHFGQLNAATCGNVVLAEAENDNVLANNNIATVADAVSNDIVANKNGAVGSLGGLDSSQTMAMAEEGVVLNSSKPANINYIKKEILDGRAFYIEGDINSNFYTSAQLAHVPASVIKSFVSVLKHKVNFRSRLHHGDKFAVAYEKSNGKVLFARIKSKRCTIDVYKGVDNDDKYYYKNGSPLNNDVSLVEFKKPVNYSRISSPYGYRFHPIARNFKKHNGIDYAAPLGTPVYAAYNGHIKEAGHDRYRGKYVVVQHENGYETLYAHLSAINNLQKGKYVLCGTQLGSVGSTGMSTGPHLHFGLRKNGVFINPAIKLRASRVKLCGNYLNSFQKQVKAINAAILRAKN